MSRKNLFAFFEKIEEDKDLQERLRIISQDTEAENLARVVKVAAEAGFKFTAKELAKVRANQVFFFPGTSQEPAEAGPTWCCHWKQGCMPGQCAPI
jgi:predicted ribosomally synthesized peptide with nif11-like leader